MEEVNQYQQDFSLEIGPRLRDIEERQRLLKDRILLIGDSLVKERERTLKDIRELKHSMLLMQEENMRIKELLARISEQLQFTPRKEELLMLQRQFDLFREH